MAFAIAGSTALAIGAVAAGTGALASGISAIGSNQRRKSRARELDEYAKQSPLYQGSKPISEYYQQAMNRYKENPYQSQQYQLGAMNAQRATAQGLGALQDRRSAIGGISRLALGQNAAMQNLGAQAEAQRNARFGQLGSATQMKNADLMQQFDINKMTPYNRVLGLKQMKSAAAAEEYARDKQNTFDALGNLASVGMMASSPSSSGGAGAVGANFGTNYGQYGGNVDFSKYGVSMPKQTGFKSQFGKTYNTGG
tara:strand:- start:1064 stop:1825 length:762 start_codon:yes stop_codon:yes gene_type:complete